MGKLRDRETERDGEKNKGGIQRGTERYGETTRVMKAEDESLGAVV